MTPTQFLRFAIRPAYEILPSTMASPRASLMILAICLQESRLEHRRQIRGPARGFPQFELGLHDDGRVYGGVAGVLTHERTRGLALALCGTLNVEPHARAVYEAIQYQDILAAGFSRLLLWTLPGPLASPMAPMDGWQDYLQAWRPGKPHPETWLRCWNQAWETVRTHEGITS